MQSINLRAWLGLFVLAVVADRSAFAVDAVVLTTGETLRGEILESTADHIALHHPVLGDLTINIKDVQSFALHIDEQPPPPEITAPVTAGDAEAPQAPVEPPPIETPEEEKQWKSHFDFGFAGNAGQTEDSNLRLAFKTVWTRPMNVITLDTSYLYTTNGGNSTEDQFTAGVFSEWPQPDSPWSYFAQARYDHDEFNTWIARITGGGGVAYRLIDIEEPVEGTDYTRAFQLKVRAGAGVAREFGSGNKDLQPEAILGADLLWKINSWQDLTASTTYFPNLTDGEFRLVSAVEWVLKIEKLDGINLKIGAAHEYQSRTSPGVDPNDLSVYAALGIDF